MVSGSQRGKFAKNIDFLGHIIKKTGKIHPKFRKIADSRIAGWPPLFKKVNYTQCYNSKFLSHYSNFKAHSLVLQHQASKEKNRSNQCGKRIWGKSSELKSNLQSNKTDNGL
jgi:hypothetical protein